MQGKGLEQKQQGKELVVNLQLSRRVFILLALGLALVALLGYLAWGQREVSAASLQVPAAGSTGLRRYYLTKDGYGGDSALTACASGYHMASLWEILDVSSLEYSIDLGKYWPASDDAPPTDLVGWVRTGFASDGSSTPGQANCNAWTSSSGGIHGTVVKLPTVWQSSEVNVHVWKANIAYCSELASVWCVED